MRKFLTLLSQEVVQVRLAALQTAYSMISHSPQDIAGLFKESITPILYEVSDLVVKCKVDLGPFTHTTDAAMQLRYLL